MAEVVTTGWPDRLLTLADWEQLPVDERHQVECSEGVLVVTPKPYPRHQRAVTTLVHQLDRELPDGWSAVPDVDVLLSVAPLTVRAPDVVVTSTAALTANPPRFRAEDVVLAVEILSEGSRRTDRVTKLSEYAEVGIAEYWVLDLDLPVTLTRHRLDPAPDRRDAGYQLVGELHGAVELELLGAIVRLDLDALAPRPAAGPSS